VILLDISTMWCTYCQIEAALAESMYEQYRSQGFTIINVLFADYNGDPITTEACKGWADFYGHTFPILADFDEGVYGIYNEHNAIPLNLVIDRDFVIQYKATGFNETAIRTSIEKLL
jgi:peroxiredoxin